MPSSSAKQHRFMEAVAHSKSFASKVGVPQSVGQDFSKADKGKTFKKGGIMKMKETMGPKSMSKDVEAGSNKLGKFGQSKVQKRGMTKGTELGISGPTEGIEGGGMKKGGKAKVKKMASGGSASSRADGIASKGKTKGKFC
jgi:hypothetical protein